MKQFILLMTTTTILTACDVKRKDKIADDSKLAVLNDSLSIAKKQQVQNEAMEKSTTVQLIDSVFDFGTIIQDEKVSFNYRFKNAGTNPLIIFTASASCGCTVPEKPEKPIMPGEEGFIKVEFNSSGKTGRQLKDITVTANTVPAFPVLKLTGEIKPKQ
jgi:hypothetical protein